MKSEESYEIRINSNKMGGVVMLQQLTRGESAISCPDIWIQLIKHREDCTSSINPFAVAF